MIRIKKKEDKGGGVVKWVGTLEGTLEGEVVAGIEMVNALL